MLVTLTHQILSSVSSRPPGMPVSECRGMVERRPSPPGAEAHFELFYCPACDHLIPTYRRPGEEWQVINEYPAPPAPTTPPVAETAQAAR